MNNYEIKNEIIERLFGRDIYTKKVNSIEYRTRCPFCGDSNNINTGHLYLRINPNDNYPILYKCFKCDESGILRETMLNMLDIYDLNIKSELLTLNKTSDKFDKNINENNNLIFFDYIIPENKLYLNKINYIENRLGVKFSDNDLKDIKIITSLKEFLIENNIKTIQCSNSIAHTIEKDYVGFLSFGNSHILFRDITNTHKISWLKYPITEESKTSKVFYSISSNIDIYSNQDITINLAEGILDILSVKYNLGYNQTENIINIAVTGRHYDSTILYLIDMGLIGSNIKINIFSDNDSVFNKKNKNPTTYQYFMKLLRNYKYLFKEINIYYNELEKDVGTTKDRIILKKYKII